MNVDIAEKGFSVISNKNNEFSQLVKKNNNFIYRLVSDNRLPNGGFFNSQNKPRQLVNLHVSFTEVKKVLTSPVIKSIAKELLPSERIIIDHSKVSIKFKDAEMEWQAHQDNGYGERKGYSVAIMLEKCSESNGAIQFIPGSHLNGIIPHKRDKLDKQAFIPSSLINEKEFVSVCGESGDILIFDLNTVHRSGNNITDTLRAILIFEIRPYKKYVMSDGNSMPFFLVGKFKLDEWIVSVVQFFFKGLLNTLKTRIKHLLN